MLELKLGKVLLSVAVERKGGRKDSQRIWVSADDQGYYCKHPRREGMTGCQSIVSIIFRVKKTYRGMICKLIDNAIQHTRRHCRRLFQQAREDDGKMFDDILAHIKTNISVFRAPQEACLPDNLNKSLKEACHQLFSAWHITC